MEIGIVGLPNVGKSTLFNALLKKQQALVANYSFTTIEPNVGIVPVPDPRLDELADVIVRSPSTALRVSRPPVVPATVRFVDIAGLVKGASEGEGLGNKFLAHIREVDAILFLLRDFSDENIIRSGSVNPKEDLEILRLELELADAEAKEKINLLSKKPALIVHNVDEDKLAGEGLRICAKLEEELAALSEEEQREYLKQLGIEKTSLEKVIAAAFEILGLQTFLTAPSSAKASEGQGGKFEVRAWTIKNGSTALTAAGVIHTDFAKNFIKADVVNWEDFVRFGGWVKAREAGKVRLEGRDYVMAEGDVVEFKVGV
ncbi:MAG: GTP-binding protein YchF [Candidatus Amesbacteria bacterium GW2011_GWA2_47_70]|uniref:GTP-binding protein YchF n=1 Tax=Candidatus Amesbacteria bacterium GW2011_GWC2_45_19 TaxID=1618366 RepID=A0A0G1Q1W7_9BACT|nr:MAG: GTP-binding protein YchF [Candidatus Amesbacteria bacterium GW2011_GWC2_45_19]KKU69069.1 MAG: GTP-binding protein YchF [Microgenomates group bacterium GW2011_GWC1_47_20]KKU80187.1 MAG: GTP-binding protein YchF [Candidatus Amesbacteria bacterium GW2011_GWA2_47_70]